MNPSITAIGTANPQHRFSQIEVTEFMARAHQLENKEKQRLFALYRASGIDFRYSVLSDYGLGPDKFRFYPEDFQPFPSTAKRNEIFRQCALPLAIDAIDDCLPTNFQTETITHLITISCTGLYAPGLDIELIEALKLPLNTKRTSVNFMGCYGVFNALRIAKDICFSNPSAKILLVSVELCTLHFQKKPHHDFILSNALFGDGAAAALVQMNSHGFDILKEQCFLLPEGKDEMQWQLGNTGFEMTLSEMVPNLIERNIGNVVSEFLASANFTLSDVEFYAVHPGGKRIVSSIVSALELEPEDCKSALKVLRNYGNMSSATILFVLKEIWNNLNLQDHHKNVLGLAFGPGLTLEGTILRINLPQ